MRALRGTALALLVAGLVSACGGGSGGGGFINGSSSSNGGGSSSSSSSSSGGSSSSSSSGGGSANNVLPVNISLGPNGNYPNFIFVSVTLCIPGSSSCQTIDNVLVDTGSYGLRILNTALSLGLPSETAGGGTVGECAVFADGFTWGPVATADVRIAGETAHNLPVQVFGAGFSNFPDAPTACSNGHGTNEKDLATFGANGLLGIGSFAQDCGGSCANTNSNGKYFSCGSSAASCGGVSQNLGNQVTNPVVLFAGDNNGVIVKLPGIGSGGQNNVSGSLVFGIGTQSNNQLGSAQVLTLNSSANFKTSFNGSTIDAFIDSGSNALFFADGSIPTCSTGSTDFYCPNSTDNFSAQMIGYNNTTVVVPFAVGNANNLVNSGNSAFNDLAGSIPGTISGSFDWGMPFFYGHNVYFAIEGKSTPAGLGPYYAF